MSGYPAEVQAGRTPRHGCPRLTLVVRRVLGVGVHLPVGAEFGFDPAAPLTVSARFTAEGGPRVLWQLGRDLLHQGLRERSGTGDVRIRPSRPDRPATALLQLASADTAALFELPVPPLAAWLAHTYTLVPAGRELTGVDWDAVAADLTGGPGRADFG
ncbi:SsgA family sporulation/cell division regulator [Streptomyces sp. NPDC004111]|uniref:SsgA family sporulation/cell division regulator n=1 Tax=Streptomyces sp. NPDC004111 TaxID=3364690 RepID=UPI0036C8E333